MDLLDEFHRRDWETGATGTVRFAMVGLGWWTRDYAMPAVEDADYCETTVVVSGSPEKADRVRDRTPSVERALTYDEFHRGVAADEYDAIYVCTPNARHLPHAEAAARLGKDVLCEKPMEATAERAAEMVEVCDGEVTLAVAYRMHTDPAVRRARELVDAGVVGEPRQLHGHMSQRLLDVVPETDQWRLDPDLVGYGTSVMDLGVYPINTARFLLGADPTAVVATAASVTEPFADVPDEHASFVVEFPGGVQCTASCSQNAFATGRLTLVGTDGELALEPVFLRSDECELSVTAGRTHRVLDYEPVDQMREQFDYVADCLLADARPVGSGEHGLVDVRTMAAVYESAASGERVAVDADE